MLLVSSVLLTLGVNVATNDGGTVVGIVHFAAVVKAVVPVLSSSSRWPAKESEFGACWLV